MKRFVVIAGTCFLLAGFVGCGSRHYDGLINEDIAEINKATAQVRIVKDKVDEAVEKSTKANKNLTADDLKPAVAAALQLREIGKAMLKVKERTDALKGTISKEEEQTLVKNVQPKFTEACAAQAKSRDELDKSLRKAKERAPKEAMDGLVSIIRLSEGEFEVLAR